MESRLECSICKKTFTQRSSLVRHSKKCISGPAPSLRQKSCWQCTNSKTKCDLKRPRCTRCEQRSTVCEYIIPMTRGVHARSPSKDHDDVPSIEYTQPKANVVTAADLGSISFTDAPQNLLCTEIGLELNSTLTAFGFPNPLAVTSAPDFNFATEKDTLTNPLWSAAATTDTVPCQPLDPISQPDISSNLLITDSNAETGDFFLTNNWLLFNRALHHSESPLLKHSMETLLRVLKTWPKALAKGFQPPPIFHFTHTRRETLPWPLANCVAICKTWIYQSGGATEIVRQTVVQEMRSLFEQYWTMDERHLLATVQALAMYSTILMFPGKGQISVSLIDPAIFACLARVIQYVAKTGLVLTEERDCVRPSWASWVHVTAKRRAVLTLYLLHWSYAVYHGIESFACSQLGFMPAPAPKFLWQCETKEKWEELYLRWMAQWGGRPYMMSDLQELESSTALGERAEQWLEDADEFGVLLLSIANTTEQRTHCNGSGGIQVLSS